jgi:hypothetical protein
VRMNTVRSERASEAKEDFYESKFGAEDFEKIKVIKAWIDGHPLKSEVRAILIDY